VSIDIRFRINRGAFTLDVELSLPSQGVTSLFGPSGCGKSTLLRAIAGLDRHPGGFLALDGETWQDGQRFVPVHRRPLGYVFQEASLFEHLDVEANIAYGARRTPADDRKIAMAEAIELLDIAPLLKRRPAGLSGGERQRVAIARALAVSPELLLMDEPLAAVDVSRKQEILPYIENLHRELEIPVIHVSHLPDEVGRLADHLVLMETGRVLAQGDTYSVFTRLDLPLAHRPDSAAIIEAQVIGHEPDFALTRLGFDGGTFLAALPPLAAGEEVRLRIASRDVSLTHRRQSGTSILNILECTVDDIAPESEAQVTVRLMAGPTPLLASITRKSAHELGLETGMKVFAQVKSVALLGAITG
jgi:molybdate transport system ATP-binding protein